MPPLPSEIHIHPIQGSDSAAGSSMAPFKTLTHALKQAKPGDMIQLSRGVYSVETGEQFPLVIDRELLVVGNVPTQGNGVIIAGSGSYSSPEFGLQSVTLVLQADAELQGITVTNLAERGTGVWIEAGRPTLSGCTFSQSGREGVFVTGEANPVISGCLFKGNGASGLALVRDARGEIRSNMLRQNGFGIAISDRAAPIVSNNQIQENRSGLLVSGLATPILRGNIFSQNQEDGLAVLGKAAPDLGQRHEPAGNRFRDNQRYDLRCATHQPLITVGNQLNPLHLQGPIELRSTGTPAPTSPPPHLPNSPPPHPFHPLAQALLDRHLLPPDALASDAPLTWSVWQSWLRQAGLAPHSAFPEQVKDTRPLIRLQVIRSLVEVLDLPRAHPAMLRCFRDRAQVPSGDTLALATALRHRLILSAYPDRLLPLQVADRTEAAALLYQALALKQQVATLELSQILQAAPPLVPPPRPTRPPIVVLDPGHGGDDPGVATQAESDEEQAPAAPDPMLNPNEVRMSPLPAGSLTAFPDLAEFGLVQSSPFDSQPPQASPRSAPRSAPVSPPISASASEMPPIGIASSRDPDAPAELPVLEEKTINLAVAQAVADFLRQQGVQVVLTRDADQSLTLAERVAVAAEQNADLFISLHANASLIQQPSLNGVETYHYPGSTESRRLAWAIHKSLTRSPDVTDRGLHEATFLPLHQPRPAVHLELGYITGDQDAPSLANLAYHRFLGRSIANGILRYVGQMQQMQQRR